MVQPSSPTSPPAPDIACATVRTLPGAAGNTAAVSTPLAAPRRAAAPALSGRNSRQPVSSASRHLDELALHRERLRAERLEVETRADDRLHEMQVQEFIRVPRLMVAITNSLAAASVLELARLWTERSMHERGTPWVDMPVETWLNYTGLCEQEWVEARRALRSLRLIRERRRFDLDRNELVCDLAFESEAFASHAADLKEAIKAHLAEELRSRRRVACPTQGKPSADIGRSAAP